MGTFSQLAKIDGVEKLVKFKQGILLGAAREAGHIPAEHYTWVKDGACAAYVMAWFVQRYGIATHFPPARKIRPRDDEASISTAAMFVHYQVAYMKDPQKARHAVATLARRFDLYVTSALIEETFDKLILKLQKELMDEERDPAAIIHAYKDGSQFGHAIGLFRGKGGLHFFDPNIGEYWVPRNKLEFFVAKYSEIHRLKAMGGYGDSWAVLIGTKRPDAVDMADAIFASIYGSD